MIEPQNTMLPVAKSRPVDAPQGEGEGFGDMLAQTLGMIPQVDPSAVQQIDTGARQGHADDENPGSETPQGELSMASLPGLAAFVSPVVAEQISPTALPNGDLPALSGRPAGPYGPGMVSSIATASPVLQNSYEHTDVGVAPTSETQSSELVAHVTRPVDTVSQPSSPVEPFAADSSPVEPGSARPLQPTPSADSVRHADSVGDPGQVPVAGTPGSGEATIETAAPDRASGTRPPAMGELPGAPVPRHASAGAGVDPSDLSLEPVAAAPSPADGIAGGPTPPRRSTVVASEPLASVPEVADAVPPRPAFSPMSRVEITPDRPVRLEPIPTGTAAGSPVVEPVVTESVSVDGVAPIAAPVTDSSAAPGSATAMPEIQRPQASALAERVMQAIELQRTQPPPRSMVVDIPELEGLRLLVSVRSAGNVTVTPATGSASPDAFTPFATDLSRVLAERGFVMNGDGRQRGYNPHSDDEPAPLSSPRPRYRRATRTDNDLRI